MAQVIGMLNMKAKELGLVRSFAKREGLVGNLDGYK